MPQDDVPGEWSKMMHGFYLQDTPAFMINVSIPILRPFIIQDAAIVRLKPEILRAFLLAAFEELSSSVAGNLLVSNALYKGMARTLYQ
jgi:hypothetical protein